LPPAAGNALLQHTVNDEDVDDNIGLDGTGPAEDDMAEDNIAAEQTDDGSDENMGNSGRARRGVLQRYHDGWMEDSDDDSVFEL